MDYLEQAKYAEDHPLPKITEEDLPKGAKVRHEQDVTIIELPDGASDQEMWAAEDEAACGN